MIRKIFIAFVILILLGVPCLVIVTLHKPSQNLIISAYNQARLIFLNGGGSECINELSKRNAKFKALGDQVNGICTVKNGVQISSFSDTALNGAIVLSCPTAIKVDEWLRKIKAQSITHIGSYNCRTQRNNKIMSEHSFGNALDIVSINGAVVGSDWQNNTPQEQLLKSSYDAACNIFSNVIGPDDNALHAEHLHLDNGWGFGCALEPIKRSLLRQLK